MEEKERELIKIREEYEGTIRKMTSDFNKSENSLKEKLKDSEKSLLLEKDEIDRLNLLLKENQTLKGRVITAEGKLTDKIQELKELEIENLNLQSQLCESRASKKEQFDLLQAELMNSKRIIDEKDSEIQAKDGEIVELSIDFEKVVKLKEEKYELLVKESGEQIENLEYKVSDLISDRLNAATTNQLLKTQRDEANDQINVFKRDYVRRLELDHKEEIISTLKKSVEFETRRADSAEQSSKELELLIRQRNEKIDQMIVEMDELKKRNMNLEYDLNLSRPTPGPDIDQQDFHLR